MSAPPSPVAAKDWLRLLLFLTFVGLFVYACFFQTDSQEPTSDMAVVFTDDFDDDALDPARWAAPEHPGQFVVSDGALRLQATGGRASTAVLRPRTGMPIRQLNVTVDLTTAQRAGSGEAWVDLRQADGRAVRLEISSAHWITGARPACATPPCADGSVAAASHMPLFARTSKSKSKSAKQISIVENGGWVRFYLGGTMFATVELGPSPLAGFEIGTSTGLGEVWSIPITEITAYS